MRRCCYVGSAADNLMSLLPEFTEYVLLGNINCKGYKSYTAGNNLVYMLSIQPSRSFMRSESLIGQWILNAYWYIDRKCRIYIIRDVVSCRIYGTDSRFVIFNLSSWITSLSVYFHIFKFDYEQIVRIWNNICWYLNNYVLLYCVH